MGEKSFGSEKKPNSIYSSSISVEIKRSVTTRPEILWFFFPHAEVKFDDSLNFPAFQTLICKCEQTFAFPV